MRESFIFYKSFFDAIKELQPEEQLIIYNAIMSYQYYGELPELTGVPKAIFMLIKPQLDANNERFENGTKGGAPKGNTNAKKQKNETTQNNQNNQKQPLVVLNGENKTTENNQKQPNVNVNVNDNVNVNVNDNENVNADDECKCENETDNFSASASKDEIVDFYLNNINPVPTPHEIELLESYEQDTSHELILHAMKKAVENKARSIAYVKGILNSWASKGITTLAEVQEQEKPKPTNTGQEMQSVWDSFVKNHEKDGENTT